MARIRRAAQSAPQEVLVPEAEQPYAVPENWRWVRLGYGYEITSSKRIHKSDWRGSGVPFYRTRELVKLSKYGFVDNELFIENELYESIKETYGVPQIEDILISGVGTIGVPYVVSDKKNFYFKDGNIIWLKSNKIFNSLFIFYLYKTPFMYSQIHDMASGTTVDTYTIVNAKKTMVPLPPRAEQERIVARIESLFARLDKAREKVDAVLGRCAARKAALLHKAFSGELTAAWRKARGIGLESWEEKLSGQLFSYVTSGSRGWAKYYSEEGALFIRMGNLSHETIELNLSEVQHVKLPDDIEGQRSKLKNNDILISITADVGMVALVRDINFEGYINQHVALARPVSTVCPEFLALYLISDAGKKELKARQRGSTKVGLGLDDIKSLHLKMPTLAEQAEIVRILDELLARERRARDAAERVAARIEQIKRAVLTKAFRGELGTNDPAEPAALTEQGSLSLA
ncbi:restriction endonuclease subunit S [uncultured Desulfovibrio sp.]|uniref:restriction endonuclease subunit S n=1 Tax=uncultured Desulfovibrio sp. TaxID=167968 RepID=UPI00261E42DB|nr:restriction endonuclease subunit S [uncultured Desulfovibrio sp.]